MISSKGVCSSCEKESYHEKLVMVGTEVRTDEGKAGSTHYTFLQCQECGSIICEYVDKGWGSGGPYFKRITSSFF
jgi:hypothetical protein